MKQMKHMKHIIMTCGLAAAISAPIGYSLWSGRATKIRTITPIDTTDASLQTLRLGALPPPSPTRVSIRKEIEQARATNCSDIDAYLDSLEDRARNNGKVTALEVEPGIALIHKKCVDPDRVGQFSARMLRLQHELRGDPEPLPSLDRLAVRKRLDELLEQIRYPQGEAKKQALIRQYLDLTQHLGLEDRLQVETDLNAVAAPKSPQPDPLAADALWDAIEREPNEENRQVLIREYLNVIHRLPEDEWQVRTVKLNRRYGNADTQ
jgi:hypothetical protein